MAEGKKKKRGGKKVAERRAARARAKQAPKQGPGQRRETRPVPSEPIELVAGPPAHGGAVVAKAPDGRTVFLRGALEGERVVARVLADHKSYLWAQTVQVLEPSSHRVAHVWPEPADIGSANADLGHVDPDEQRRWKARVLQDQLRRVGGVELAERVAQLHPDGLEVTPVADGGRTRIQLVAGPDGRLGMRPYRSDQIVAVTDVPTAVPSIRDLSGLTAQGGWGNRWQPGDRVAVEAPTGGTPVVVTPSATYDFATGAELTAPPKWRVEALGASHDFQVRPGGFWQTNEHAPETLVTAVLGAADVEAGQTVLELYSGAGLFSRFLADGVGPSGQLLTLEGDEGAVEDAGANLIDAVEDDFAVVYQGNVDADSVRELASEADRRVDTVVLDPPRKGAGKEVVRAISGTGAKRVVLVSCDPAAAARDLRDFRECGFEVDALQAWDLFPHTHHFETVATLTRTGNFLATAGEAAGSGDEAGM